jgi:uncharacterized SAM-binding protein YcdF (DUF218 family)
VSGVDLLLSPLAWLVLAGALAGVAGGLPHAGAIRVIALLLGLVALGAMTPWFANRLVGRLESQVAPAACARLPATLVVLAGGVDLRPRHPGDFSALNGASRRRMDAAISAWRLAPETRLLLSGGPSARHAPAIASLMAAYARWAGVPEDALSLEVGSLDTWQSAQAVAARLPPGTRIGLVTSGSHWPRARVAFAHARLDACAVPADLRKLPVGLPWALIPRLSALEKTEDALHEWVGLAWYRWRARRDG